MSLICLNIYVGFSSTQGVFVLFSKYSSLSITGENKRFYVSALNKLLEALFGVELFDCEIIKSCSQDISQPFSESVVAAQHG